MKINSYTLHKYTSSYERYEKQLQRGTRTLSTKTAKKLGEGFSKGDVGPLVDGDIKRIKKEMSILKSKITAAGFGNYFGDSNE